MYNDSIIQEQSGLNAFYNKIYSLVGIGVGISALVSGLMMTVFQDFFVQILTTAPMVYYIAIAAELILVFVASGKAVKNSPSFCSSNLLDLLIFERLYLELYHCSLHASDCL